MRNHATAPSQLRNFDQLPDSAFVDIRVVRGLFGDPAASTIWRWVKRGTLARPDKVGPNKTCWNVGRLRRALAERQAAA
jgi:predicted DNA-binding transcriptional regulator AlpA